VVVVVATWVEVWAEVVAVVVAWVKVLAKVRVEDKNGIANSFRHGRR